METGHPSSAVNSGSGNRALGLTAIQRGFELFECLLVAAAAVAVVMTTLR